MLTTSVSALPSRDLSRRHVRSLVQFFALKCARDKGLPFRFLSAEAENLLVSHDWKSDLSAMESTIRRAAIMAEGDEIGAEVIRLPNSQFKTTGDGRGDNDRLPEAATRALLGHTVSDVERDLILLTLECCLGNRTRAADILGISVRTLRNKLKEYSLIGISIPYPGEARKMNSSHAKRGGNGRNAAVGDP